MFPSFRDSGPFLNLLPFPTGGGGEIGPIPPVITVGPAWTNNEDGTATVTWTTDQATDSKVSYGATSSYGSTATDATITTDHSITISGLADGVYHFSVSDTADTYSSADTLGAVTSSLLGHFMVYPHHLVAADASKWFFEANQDESATGVAWCLNNKTTALGETLNPMWAAFEGAMYPGVVFTYAPDYTSGSTPADNSSPFRFRNLGVSGAYIGWDVPSWVLAGNGFPSGKLDSLYVFCSSASLGHFDVIRTRSGSDATIASNITPAGSGYFATAVSLSAGNELQAGDIVKIKTNGTGVGGEGVRVGCVMAYASAGTFTNGVAHRVINATAHLQMTQYYGGSSGTPVISTNGSNPDVAWEIGPAGSPIEFIGGADHQGPAGTYGQETSITEAWTKNGASWTVAQDYQRANIKMTRSSTAYYNVGNPNIGSLVTAYEARSFDVFMTGQLTYGVSMDTGSLYCPMLPIKSFATAYNTQNGVSPESVAIGSLPITWTDKNPAVTWASGGSVVAGIGLYQGAGSGSTVFDNRYLGTPKNYARISPASASGASAATVKRGFGRFFECPAAGPVAPTLSAASCTVSADGRTIFVVPVTKTGGITGNTGLTFKRGGSSISAGQSITNNADGTLTVLLTLANKVLSSDTITVDVATASLYDAYGIMMAAASGIAVVNTSTQ